MKLAEMTLRIKDGEDVVEEKCEVAFNFESDDGYPAIEYIFGIESGIDHDKKDVIEPMEYIFDRVFGN